MLPQEFLDRFSRTVPHDGDPKALLSAKHFKSFRINTLKNHRETVFAKIRDEGVAYELVPWYQDAFIVNHGQAKQLLSSSLGTQGMIYAQGLESMLAPLALAPKPGWRVLDLCAAPGSKTTQIAAIMGNEGLILANEPVRDRSFRLKAVTALLGANVQLMSKDGRSVRGDGTFDGILVDAPCSSEGRICVDNPKSYEFWSLRKVHEMAYKQRGLLENAGRLLKKGGTLVYATCTFGKEENEDVVQWFLDKTKGQFHLETININGIPTYPSSLPPCIRVMPNEVMEGFFLAKFSL